MLDEVLPGHPTRVTHSRVGKPLVEQFIPKLLRNPKKFKHRIFAVRFVSVHHARCSILFHGLFHKVVKVDFDSGI